MFAWGGPSCWENLLYQAIHKFPNLGFGHTRFCGDDQQEKATPVASNAIVENLFDDRDVSPSAIKTSRNLVSEVSMEVPDLLTIHSKNRHRIPVETVLPFVADLQDFPYPGIDQ